MDHPLSPFQKSGGGNCLYLQLFSSRHLSKLRITDRKV
jgi:hypothetical protein